MSVSPSARSVEARCVSCSTSLGGLSVVAAPESCEEAFAVREEAEEELVFLFF